jgi:hypothetical protein
MFNRPELNGASDGLSLPRPSPGFDILVHRFSISTPSPLAVSLVLPPGSSRRDFLELAHEEFQKAYQRPLIVEDNLSDWITAQNLQDTYFFPCHINVEIRKAPTTSKTREEHDADIRQQGRVMALQNDTAVAFAAYWLKTRADIFEGSGVQTRGRGLQLNSDGLVEVEYFKTMAVAVSFDPSARN